MKHDPKETDGKSREHRFIRRKQNLYKVMDGKEHWIGLATKLTGAERDFDTGQVILNVCSYYARKWHTTTLDRDKFTSWGILALRKKGADIHDDNRYDVWQFLDGQERKITPKLRHRGVGWRTHAGKSCFLLNQGHNVTSSYAGEYRLAPAGALGDWMTAVREHVLGHPELEAMIAVGFSSALIQPLEHLTETKSLLVHLWGDSSRGKTTAASLALSVWGFPDSGHGGMMRTFNTTENALMAAMRGNRGVCLGFDEASASKIPDFSSLIYNLVEGSEKARLDDKSNFQQPAAWRTTVITTGELSLLEHSSKFTGLSVRILEMGNRRWTESAEHAESIKGAIRQNYGVAGDAFAAAICAANPKEIEKRWHKYRMKVTDALPISPFRDRLAKNLAIILTAGYYANKAVGLGLDLKQMVLTLAGMVADVPIESVGVRAYRAIQEYVHRCQSLFDPASEGTVHGSIVRDKKGDIERVLIFPESFRKILQELGFQSSGTVLSEWKTKGWIEVEKGKNTVKRALKGRNRKTFRPNVHCIIWQEIDATPAPKPSMLKRRNNNNPK